MHVVKHASPAICIRRVKFIHLALQKLVLALGKFHCAKCSAIAPDLHPCTPLHSQHPLTSNFLTCTQHSIYVKVTISLQLPIMRPLVPMHNHSLTTYHLPSSTHKPPPSILHPTQAPIYHPPSTATTYTILHPPPSTLPSPPSTLHHYLVVSCLYEACTWYRQCCCRDKLLYTV